MSTRTDPLRTTERSDRLHYATGEMLGADDFQAEQTYHRRQQALALLYLHGRGTVAGLTVGVLPIPGAGGGPDEVELFVEPGLAIDGAGRLIEVPRRASLRLRRWYEFIASIAADNVADDATDLRAAFRADPNFAPLGVVVADVFLSFHACDRGLTPAFASGPFDALNATQPSRVRDGYDLTLILRDGALALPDAFDYYAGVASVADVRGRIAGAYTALTPPRAINPAQPMNEIPAGFDPTAVLLARLRIPANAANPPVAPTPNFSPARWAVPANNLSNDVRRWVVPPAALIHFAPVV